MKRMGNERLFGTDGIRGRVGHHPMTPDVVLRLGWAIGRVLSDKVLRPKVLIGKDTRLSGYLFESALECGLSASGVDILLVGPMPTPAIAYLSGTHSADLGIVITASHNNYLDNGIKIFSERGEKISRELESLIEREMQKPIMIQNTSTLGKASRIHDARGRYIEFCKSAIPHLTDFSEMKLVIDCANGSTYYVAPSVFHELGATVVPINVAPNGMNININSGTIDSTTLQERVKKENADLGIAFDGDGDRVILIDHLGELINGDEILFLLTKVAIQEGRFHGGVIGTEMSNTGLALALKKLDVPFERVSVGEHHVISALKKRKWHLGGEPSGHILNMDVTGTSDAIITALTVVYALVRRRQTLHELKKGITKYPQIECAIPCSKQSLSLDDPNLQQVVEDMERALGENGRILLRFSGTEPVLRLMIEAEDSQCLHDVMEKLINIIEKRIV